MDPVLLAAVRNYLVDSDKEKLFPTLEDSCRATACCLGLALPITTYDVTEMDKYFHFSTHNYGRLTARPRDFLFVTQTAAAAENLREKARLWDKYLSGKIRHSVEDSLHMLSM